MRKIFYRFGVVATSATVLVAALATSGHAAPRKPVLNDVTTPVSTHVLRGATTPISAAQYEAGRQQAGRPLTGSEQAALHSSACYSESVSQWRNNIYGGTLIRINGTVTWCQDGWSVWGGGYSWNTYTNFGWSFDHWTNPPNGYYPSGSRYDTVAEAEFCIAWCSGDSYLGLDLWGNANGSSSWSTL